MCLLMAEVRFFYMRAVAYMCAHGPTAHVSMRVHGSTVLVCTCVCICVLAYVYI